MLVIDLRRSTSLKQERCALRARVQDMGSFNIEIFAVVVNSLDSVWVSVDFVLIIFQESVVRP